MVLKPKSKLKSGSKKSWAWSLGISKLDSLQRALKKLTPLQRKSISILTGFTLLVYFLSSLFQLRSGSGKVYPVEHGYYQNEIPASRQFIFPYIEHGSVLREIGIKGLFTLRTELNGESKFVLNTQDKPLSDDEKKKTTDQILLVKRSFLDHGKLVYRKESNHPEIVIVTLIDFENYPVDTIVDIVQNRVDYAQRHNYGVYVRWIQEFIPLLKSQNPHASYEYIKPLIMRAAMHAFPQAKYLMFVDQDAVIMKTNLPLQQHILNPKILELGLLKDKPVVPNSNIKTYKHFQTAGTKIIVPQGPDGVFDLSTFLVSTDLYGKAFLEYLIDPLFMDYDWPSFESSLGHLLQWHPQLLKRTAVVSNKIIAATYDPVKGFAAPGPDAKPVMHYTEGDLVISLKGCKQRGSCASDINTFYAQTRK
ncbi:hypothetical protein ZYGR_0N07290 [Zygosaccharomyces rouxii]|uniref:ZYRO0D17028p n=2 Tax=Zygosaccharomyces rouxii TaxID=4956 RepID=C5DWR7_ZYGRC|nr:uncharacterized protein ZYRO0D17028g [Zygosaccharomyces rouxii]KAH9201146.1 putative alpha-1,6-mannosyltransferase MNN11 [Zygosaccharomyces rouxii]GAV49322.1 hypothetical protein ZYGR_0N07290 [Zygosaccharomyces rouxii]CAQ43496.1 Probable alpha-1,6-mannosyltransferase MNN11 [Zygosaccharomyces rouxii]CAR28236.1 ZYRO0D17028p [Zygosaccharomyces rouxii]